MACLKLIKYNHKTEFICLMTDQEDKALLNSTHVPIFLLGTSSTSSSYYNCWPTQNTQNKDVFFCKFAFLIYSIYKLKKPDIDCVQENMRCLLKAPQIYHSPPQHHVHHMHLTTHKKYRSNTCTRCS